MKIDQDILDIIDSGHSKENVYFLPDVQLDRKVYLKVNKVLTALGGKWNRKAKGHIFDKPIEDAIENVILTGEVVDKKKELQFFETPEHIAVLLCDIAGVRYAKTVLEPSAGKGAILKTIRELNPDAKLMWCELDKENVQYVLALLGRPNIINNPFLGHDFLKTELGLVSSNNSNLPINTVGINKVDCVVMNPPFTKQQDIDHVTHALKFVKDGGVLVSVMSPSIKFRTNKKTKEFLDLISQYDYEIIDLPEGSFKESGTMVNTIVLKIRKG